MNHLSKGGVAFLDLGLASVWQQDLSKILEIVRIHHAGQTAYRLIGPQLSPQGIAALRRDLLSASPGLQGFVEVLKARLAGSCAVYIPSLGLRSFDENTRALMAYVIAVCMGNPTATDTRQVIWDVKARERGAGYFSTFSETDLEAAFHTDTQYYPDPEPTFLLYSMTPARCGGGYSSICDARALRADIEHKERWVADVLTKRHLPFRVPSAFVTTTERGAIQATLAPVFSDTPLIRYRADTLSEGLLNFPEYADPDTCRALDAFERRLSDCPHIAEFFLPLDSLIVVDNHRALHARTAFQDQDRHLLRIRLRDDEPQPQNPSVRMVSREGEALTVS